MKVYYNEYDANAAQWLKNLIASGELPDGEVDTRSILEVKASEVSGYRQQHYFSGIGGWPLALRLAGLGERPVITGSAPCQPFSAAGKGRGHEDERHLWPALFRLIREQDIGTCFGEQVSAAIGQGWLDGVFSDLEGEGYACGAAVLGAHSVGAPHIRQRLYWVADRRREHDERRGDAGDVPGAAGGVEEEARQWERSGDAAGGALCGCGADGMGDGDSAGHEKRTRFRGDDAAQERTSGGETVEQAGPWSDYRIIPCTDGKARRTGARVFPLAHGIPRGVGSGGAWRKGLARSASRARVGMLRGIGNAIVPELAAEFVMAYMEARNA